MTEPTRVVVVGQGYVGLPLAMRSVEVGHHVVGYDTDAARVKALAAGESYVEDVPNDMVTDALASGRPRSSTQPNACSGFEVAVITVSGPLEWL